MKLVKTIGLAAVVAMAATAFVGTTSASAHFTGYCFENFRLCPLNKVIALAGWIHWISTGAVSFEGTISEKCGEAFAKSNEVKKELADEGPMEGTLETFTFSGCEPCTSIKVSGTPKFKLSVMNEEKEEVPNWLMNITGVTAIAEGCPFGVKCKFGGEINGFVEIEEKGATLNTNKSSLKFQEGTKLFCGESTQLNLRLLYYYLLDNAPFFTVDVIWPTIFV